MFLCFKLTSLAHDQGIVSKNRKSCREIIAFHGTYRGSFLFSLEPSLPAYLGLFFREVSPRNSFNGNLRTQSDYHVYLKSAL